jgi:hypothetical protein
MQATNFTQQFAEQESLPLRQVRLHRTSWLLQICWFCAVHCSFGTGFGSSALATDIEIAKVTKRNANIVLFALIVSSIAD